MPTIRSMVRDIQVEMRNSADLLPDRASELLNKLTALYGNCNDELRIADWEYKRVLLKCLQTSEAANRARIEAETSPEYLRRQEAKDTKDLALEMIRSLKTYLKVKAEEMRMGG